MKNIIILLENPKYAGNIGMVCRLIANFNLPPLRIIGKKKDLHFEMEWMAHNANEELSKIKFFEQNKEAKKDLSILIGTTMIKGKDRVGFIHLSDLTSTIEKFNIPDKKIGIVFGREDRGLSNSTVDICDFLIDFQLPGSQPSMNLSHSVSFILGTIYSSFTEEMPRAVHETLEKGKFYDYVKRIFDLIGMNQFHGKENLAIKRFKKIIDSSSITKEDLNFLYKIFQKVEFYSKNDTQDIFDKKTNS